MNAAAARQLTTAYKLRQLARRVAPAAVVARALRTEYVTVADYLAGKNMEPGVQRAVQTTFGKKVKAAWIALTGRAPRTIGATITAKGKAVNIKVAVYPVSVGSIFEQVWAAGYAK